MPKTTARSLLTARMRCSARRADAGKLEYVLRLSIRDQTERAARVLRFQHVYHVSRAALRAAEREGRSNQFLLEARTYAETEFITMVLRALQSSKGRLVRSGSSLVLCAR